MAKKEKFLVDCGGIQPPKSFFEAEPITKNDERKSRAKKEEMLKACGGLPLPKSLVYLDSILKDEEQKAKSAKPRKKFEQKPTVPRRKKVKARRKK